MANRSRGFVPRARKIASYDWAGFFTATNVTVAPSSKALIGSFVVSGADHTITRTRAMLTVASDQSSVTEQQVGALGAVVVSDVALAVGATAIPGPLTDIDDDMWFMYQGITSFGLQAGNANPQYIIDSGAQRVLQDGRSVAIMYENGSSTFSIHLMLVIRMLFRLRS